MKEARSSLETLVILKLQELTEKNEPVSDSEEERSGSHKGTGGVYCCRKPRADTFK